MPTSFHSRLQIYANNFGHFVLLLHSHLSRNERIVDGEDFFFCLLVVLITIDDNHKKISTKHKMQKFIIIIFSWFNETSFFCSRMETLWLLQVSTDTNTHARLFFVYSYKYFPFLAKIYYFVIFCSVLNFFLSCKYL